MGNCVVFLLSSVVAIYSLCMHEGLVGLFVGCVCSL